MMDRHMSQALDRWLTTPPEDSEPDEDEGCEFCGTEGGCGCEQQYEEACREWERIEERRDAARRVRSFLEAWDIHDGDDEIAPHLSVRGDDARFFTLTVSDLRLLLEAVR